MTTRSLLGQLTATPLLRPCDEPWEDMIGSDRVRHCGSCARDVFFVSAMSEAEAEIRLLNASDVVPCIRYARRADGSVVHVPLPRLALPPTSSSRARLAATALGVTLSTATAYAGDPSEAAERKAPAQCVAYASPAAASPPAPAPSGQASAAAAPAPSPPAATPPHPVPLGGAPPMPHQQPAFGTLILKSKVARQVTLIGIALTAPLSSYRLTPGDFVLDVRDPNGKLRLVRAHIDKDKATTIDLDRR